MSVSQPQPSSGEDGAAYWKTEWQRVRKSESQLRSRLTAAEQRVEAFEKACIKQEWHESYKDPMKGTTWFHCKLCRASARTSESIQHAPECILAQSQQEQAKPTSAPCYFPNDDVTG